LGCLFGGLFLAAVVGSWVAGAVKNEVLQVFIGFVILGAGLTSSWWLMGLAGELDYALRRLWYKLVSKDHPEPPPPETSPRNQQGESPLKLMFQYCVAWGVIGAVIVGIFKILAALGITGGWAALLFGGLMLFLILDRKRRR
jgi:hypothetical protein